MKQKFIEYFMKVAELTASLSYAKRLKVGAVIVRDNRILSIGYNGTPSGWDNSCETEDAFGLKTKPEVIHAEQNAILKLATSNESCEDSVLFLTHAPCTHCAKLIYQAKIKTVVYKYLYRDPEGINFLKKAGVEIRSLEKSSEPSLEETATSNDGYNWTPLDTLL